MKNYSSVDPKVPENIALSFSGGGFRAASFALGCLSFLEQVTFKDAPFMQLVKFASSASGGSITLISYAVSKRKNELFGEYFKRMAGDILYGENLVNTVFEIMRSSEEWQLRPDKSRNLINAFSIAYDLKVFKKETLGILWEPAAQIPGICANTTEFRNGLLFRFQNQGDLGNAFIEVKKVPKALNDFKKIKLGDILACSSCFPVGFEPFVYPRDFTYEQLKATELKDALTIDNRYVNTSDTETENNTDLFPIMDGGIDDNQGIDSFMKAEERLQRANGFGHDLYMTCDVSSNYTNGYQFPSQKKPNWWGRKSLFTYAIANLLLLAIAIFSVVIQCCAPLAFAVIGITGIITVIIILITIQLFSIRRSAQKTHATAPLLLMKHIWFFLKLDLSIVVQQILARLTSAGEMAAVIFLKKIRRMSYGGLFQRVTPLGDPKSNASPTGPSTQALKFWGQFSLMNAVYVMSTKNKSQFDSDIKKEAWSKDGSKIQVGGQAIDPVLFIDPSIGMIATADLATSMETTLWYDIHHIKRHQPAAVIATGQFMTCFNLLRWSLRFKDDPGQNVWGKLQQQLIDQYAKFKVNPYWLYNQLTNGMQLPQLSTNGNGETV